MMNKAMKRIASNKIEKIGTDSRISDIEKQIKDLKPAT